MEIIGILASIIVLISFLFNNEKRIRMINIIGAILFVIYGISTNSISVLFLNGTLILIHIYYLIRSQD